MKSCYDWLVLASLHRRWDLPWHANPALQGVLWTSHHVPASVFMGCFELYWGSMFYARLSITHTVCVMKSIVLFISSRLIWLLKFSVQPFKSPKPVNMENLPVNNGNGQSYGYTLYETTITSGGLLRSGDNVRDRALVSPHCTCKHDITGSYYNDITLHLYLYQVSVAD